MYKVGLFGISEGPGKIMIDKTNGASYWSRNGKEDKSKPAFVDDRGLMKAAMAERS